MAKPTIVYLVVNPDYQKRGLGTLICKLLEKYVIKNDFDKLWVDNPIKDFYEKLGFKTGCKYPLTQIEDPNIPNGYSYAINSYSEWCGEVKKGIFLRLKNKNGIVIGKGRLEWLD